MEWHVSALTAQPAQALWMLITLWPQLPANIRSGLAMAPTNSPADLAPAFFTPQHLQRVLPALLATSAAQPHLHSVWGAVVKLAGSQPESDKRLACLWEQVLTLAVD